MNVLCHYACLFFLMSMQCLCNKGLNIKERDLEIGEWYEEGNDFGEHSEVYKKNAV